MVCFGCVCSARAAAAVTIDTAAAAPATLTARAPRAALCPPLHRPSLNALLNDPLAGAFLSMAVLFFKDAGGVEDTPHEASMVANALDQLQGSRGLRAILMIVGLLLVIYGERRVGCGWE